MNFPLFPKFTQISSLLIDISACLRKIHFPLPVIRFLCSRARLPKWLCVCAVIRRESLNLPVDGICLSHYVSCMRMELLVT